MKNSLSLSVHGVQVRLSYESGDELAKGALQNLAEDFEYFVGNDEGGPHAVTLVLRGQAAPASLVPLGRGLFQTKMCGVHGLGRKRVCDYGRGALVVSESSKSSRNFLVYAPGVDDLYEISYTALLSALGEELDRRGFHRVHALGIELDGRAGLVVLPQGGGKSAMAALLVQEPNVKIFSDETPLLRGDVVYPFPVRLALKPEVAAALGLPAQARLFRRRLFAEKALFPLRAVQVARPKRVSFVAFGERRVGAQPSFRTASRLLVFWGLVKYSVVGLGVAQMAEHMLRVENGPSLLGIAFSRLFTALRIVVRAKSYRFTLSEDARENARVLGNSGN